MVSSGNARPDDRRPPVGALLFWSTDGPYGHVAVYVGNSRIVSNDIGDRVPGQGGVYLVDVGAIEDRWGATYLGWAPPIYPTT
jgi:cell wall-associated NlpC family hydrolase